MKSTISAYSQLVVSLGIMSGLLMLIGSSMATPIQTSTGQASRPRPSESVMKQWIFANLIQLSQVVGKTQADFSKDRLGDAFYANYNHRVPGLPDPTWNLCSMSEQKILKTTSEELYTIRKFIRAMKTQESQNKNSQFLGKFRQIETRINSLLSYIGQLVGTNYTHENPLTITRVHFAHKTDLVDGITEAHPVLVLGTGRNGNVELRPIHEQLLLFKEGNIAVR